jgi:hypothetical protein
MEVSMEIRAATETNCGCGEPPKESGYSDVEAYNQAVEDSAKAEAAKKNQDLKPDEAPYRADVTALFRCIDSPVRAEVTNEAKRQYGPPE